MGVTIKPPRIAGQVWSVVRHVGSDLVGSDGRLCMTLIDYDQRTLFYSDAIPSDQIAPAVAYAVARAYAMLGGPTAADVRQTMPVVRHRPRSPSTWRACRPASGGRRGRFT